jgi:hypothetical protein
MGLCSLENILDKKKCSQRDIFEYGMKLVLNGRPSEFIDKILTNIINLETDKEKKILKTIQKDAAISIQHGIPPEELMWLMNSYVNIDLYEDTEKYNEINEYIIEEMENATKKTQIVNYFDMHKNVSEEIFNKYNKRKNSDG